MVSTVGKLVRIFSTVAILRQEVTILGYESELHNLCAKLDQVEDCVQEVGIMFGGIQFLRAIAKAAAIFRRYKISVDQMKGRYEIELKTKIEYALQNAGEALIELDKDEVARLLSTPQKGSSSLLAVLRKHLTSLTRKLNALPRVTVEEAPT